MDTLSVFGGEAWHMDVVGDRGNGNVTVGFPTSLASGAGLLGFITAGKRRMQPIRVKGELAMPGADVTPTPTTCHAAAQRPG
jgi:hypothetical protein